MSVALKRDFRELDMGEYDSEVEKAERAICKYSKHGVDENSFCTIRTDLPSKNYDAYTQHVTQKMGLNSKNEKQVMNEWEGVHFGGAVKTFVKQSSNDGGFKYVWVILGARQKDDGTFDLAFANHTLELGPGVPSILYSEDQAIMDSYGPYKCMMELKQKGLC